MNADGGPETWSEIWAHVKATRSGWRVAPPLGPVGPDGGRLILVRPFGADEPRESLIYLEASGAFVEVRHEDKMSGRVELVDGRVIE